MRCKNCGNENIENSKYCNKCGEKLAFESYNKQRDNKKLIIIPAVIISLLMVVILVVVVLRNQNLYVTINNSDTNEITQESSNSNESNQSNQSNEYNVENNKSHTSANDNNTTPQSNVKLRKINVIDQDSTSILTDSFKKDYGPHQVLDGYKSSVWAEGVDGPGYGESITLYFDSVYTVKQLKIVNGLINNYDGYYKNNRVSSVTIGFSDGSSQIATLKDDETGYQVINLSQSMDTSYITLTINDVYRGYKYNDTCIAEVVVLGY